MFSRTNIGSFESLCWLPREGKKHNDNSNFLFHTLLSDYHFISFKIKAKLASLALGNNEDEEGLKTFYRRVWTRIQPQLKKSEPQSKIEQEDNTLAMHNAPDQRVHES